MEIELTFKNEGILRARHSPFLEIDKGQRAVWTAAARRAFTKEVVLKGAVSWDREKMVEQ